jgi:hypothetical protein
MEADGRDFNKQLVEIMDDIGARVEARGLPPEILEALLHGE